MSFLLCVGTITPSSNLLKNLLLALIIFINHLLIFPPLNMCYSVFSWCFFLSCLTIYFSISTSFSFSMSLCDMFVLFFSHVFLFSLPLNILLKWLLQSLPLVVSFVYILISWLRLYISNFLLCYCFFVFSDILFCIYFCLLPYLVVFCSSFSFITFFVLPKFITKFYLILLFNLISCFFHFISTFFHSSFVKCTFFLPSIRMILGSLSSDQRFSVFCSY